MNIQVQLGDMAIEVENFACLAMTIRTAMEEGGNIESDYSGAVYILSSLLYDFAKRPEALSCRK